MSSLDKLVELEEARDMLIETIENNKTETFPYDKITMMWYNKSMRMGIAYAKIEGKFAKLRVFSGDPIEGEACLEYLEVILDDSGDHPLAIYHAPS